MTVVTARTARVKSHHANRANWSCSDTLRFASELFCSVSQHLVVGAIDLHLDQEQWTFFGLNCLAPNFAHAFVTTPFKYGYCQYSFYRSPSSKFLSFNFPTFIIYNFFSLIYFFLLLTVTYSWPRFYYAFSFILQYSLPALTFWHIFSSALFSVAFNYTFPCLKIPIPFFFTIFKSLPAWLTCAVPTTEMPTPWLDHTLGVLEERLRWEVLDMSDWVMGDWLRRW